MISINLTCNSSVQQSIFSVLKKGFEDSEMNESNVFINIKSLLIQQNLEQKFINIFAFFYMFIAFNLEEEEIKNLFYNYLTAIFLITLKHKIENQSINLICDIKDLNYDQLSDLVNENSNNFLNIDSYFVQKVIFCLIKTFQNFLPKNSIINKLISFNINIFSLFFIKIYIVIVQNLNDFCNCYNKKNIKKINRISKDYLKNLMEITTFMNLKKEYDRFLDESFKIIVRNNQNRKDIMNILNIFNSFFPILFKEITIYLSEFVETDVDSFLLNISKENCDNIFNKSEEFKLIIEKAEQFSGIAIKIPILLKVFENKEVLNYNNLIFQILQNSSVNLAIENQIVEELKLILSEKDIIKFFLFSYTNIKFNQLNLPTDLKKILTFFEIDYLPLFNLNRILKLKEQFIQDLFKHKIGKNLMNYYAWVDFLPKLHQEEFRSKIHSFQNDKEKFQFIFEKFELFLSKLSFLTRCIKIDFSQSQIQKLINFIMLEQVELRSLNKILEALLSA